MSMAAPTGGRRWPGLDEVVEAYEAAQARDGRAELEAFVPEDGHPDRLAILCELVRVDLEYGWRRGRTEGLGRYRKRFPELFDDPRMGEAIAFEESRLRKQGHPASSPGGRPDSALGGDVLGGSASSPMWSRPVPLVAPGAGSGEAATMARAAGGYRIEGADDSLGLGRFFASERISRDQAALFEDLHRSDPETADRLARAVATLPAPGGRFLGFRLHSELGRGAFGRVYLARQGDLADRPVALKISADVADETHALAQLQHTNIVPIYSIHRSGALQAVCMPYLGATTLADVLDDLRRHETLPDSGAALLSSRKARDAGPSSGSRPEGAQDAPTATPSHQPAGADAPRPRPARATAQVERLATLGYVQAVLWLGSRVADGLAHAHERGILHRDLKPANILFSDDGEPLLLDFNLAADTKLRVHASAALIGGTLPYMAPEHLEAFRDGGRAVDARGDLYALGVILYELLTGHHPFPTHGGPVRELIPLLIADRQGPPPGLRRWNRQVSPATEAIVRRCLEPDPGRRYPSARDLQEDLRRQLEDLPLKHTSEPSPRERLTKWARRHPRLTSTSTVSLLAACLVAVVAIGSAVRLRELGKLEAADAFHRLSAELPQAYCLLGARDAERRQTAEGIALCERVLRRYRVLDDPSWASRPLAVPLSDPDRGLLRREIGELLLIYGRTVCGQVGSSADAAARAERLQLAARLHALAGPCFAEGDAPRAFRLLGAELARLEGRADEAGRLRERAAAEPLRGPMDRLWVAADGLDRGDHRAALPPLQELTGAMPQDLAGWLLLGNGYARTGQFDEAAACYGTAVALGPKLVWPYFNRGLAYLDLKKYGEARRDFDRVVALRPELTEAYVNRALARFGLDDLAGSVADLSAALEQPDAPTRALFLRSRARARLGDREGAERDLAEGLRRQPGDVLSWVARGVARLPGDPVGALADFDAALAIDPRCRPALQNKASVLSEQLGRAEEAIGVLDAALTHHPDSVIALAGRGVLLARLGRDGPARKDARSALALDSHRAATLYQVAGIYALTSRHEPGDRREALRLLGLALRKDPGWLRVVPTDRDLDPIRALPEFRALLGAATVVAGDGAAASRGTR